MSIFGRMFRRGGPRDPDDPGDDGDDGDETAQPGAQRDEPVPMANPPRGSETNMRSPEREPDETTRPETTNPWAPSYRGDDSATTPERPPERRQPNQFALPRGVVPRPASEPKPGNGHPPVPPAQQRAGEITRRTGSTRPPPPFGNKRKSATQPPGAGEVVTPAPEVGSGATVVPGAPLPVSDAPSSPVSAAGSGAVAAGKRPSPLPALRGVAPGGRAATAPVSGTPPASAGPPTPPSGSAGSGSRRIPLPLKPPPSTSADRPGRGRKGVEAAAVAAPVAALDGLPPGSPGSIEESVSREAEVRRRIKPNTSDISQIYTELDNVAAGNPPTSVGAEAPSEPGPIVGADKVTSEKDRAALRELFNELAGHHLAQLRDLMIEIRGGTALAEWIDLSQPAVASVKGMAEQLELAELCVALDKLLLTLAEARIAGGVVRGEARAAVLDAYFPLMELVPGGLELDAERNRREPVIVHSLLRQIPGVEKVTIDKLVAASLISIATLADARPDELAAVTGVSDEIANRLVERFREYRAEAGVVASPDPAAEQRSLTQLLGRLREQNAAFDDASRRWSADAKEQKRLLRLERAETLLRIHVSLARLGQVDRLIELDRLSFKRKADFIDSYLQGARASRGLPGLSPS